MPPGTVRFETDGPVAIVTLDRPEVRNAVDDPTAQALATAFERFDADDGLSVAILTGAGGIFCAGADLKAIAAGERTNIHPIGIAPMGPTRMSLKKPVIAAIEGHAVAGGLELAIWCDLRVAAEDATLGVFSRRFGVPLIDGGTIRLPRLIGQGRALDLILTGRNVTAAEALQIGLVDRVVGSGTALAQSIELGNHIASLPQVSLRADRRSVYRQWGLDVAEALRQEFEGGMDALTSGESVSGAKMFEAGAGRRGEPVD